jgi:hypothetical protein
MGYINVVNNRYFLWLHFAGSSWHDVLAGRHCHGAFTSIAGFP